MLGKWPSWRFTKPRAAEIAATPHAVLLRSCNATLHCPRHHIRIISIATMIIDRAELHLDPVLVLLVIALPGGSASPDSGQFWGRFSRFPPTGNLLQLLPIVFGTGPLGLASTQLESSYGQSPSLLPCEFASLPACEFACLPACKHNLILHCYHHLDSESKVCALSTTEDSSTITY